MATDLSKRGEEGRRADYRPAGTDGRSSLVATVKRTFTEFSEDNMSDWAAALTYYGLLSLFPALIALVSIVGLVGDPATTTKAITDMVTKVGPSSAADTFAGPIKSITSNRGTAGVLSNDSSGATAGLRATLPIFQGGRAGALIRQSQARQSVSLENAVATERDVIATVRAAYSSWQASNEIIVSSQAAVDAAALSLEGVRAENTVGNRTILDVLNAQQELLNAQVQLVTSRRNAYIAGFTLLAAMGHAEARDLGLEEFGPLYDPLDNYNRVHHQIWDWSNDPDPVTQSTRTVDIPAQDAKISEVQTVE